MDTPLIDKKNQEVFVNIDNSVQVTNESQVTSQSQEQNSYSIQHELLQYDYNTGLMTHQYPNKTTRYYGEWDHGCPNGKGTMYNIDGSVEFDGQWKNGVFEVDKSNQYNYCMNRMEVKYANGKVKYQGGWSHNVPDGKGDYYSENGKLLWSGLWEKGYYFLKGDKYFEYQSGKYVAFSNNRIHFRGTFTSNYDFLKGIEYNTDGSILYEGEWKKNVYNGNGVYYQDNKPKYKGKWINGYYHFSGIKWFDSASKTINKYSPFYYLTKTVHSTSEISKMTTIIERLKVYALPILLFVLIWFCCNLLSSERVVKNMLQFSVVKPFVHNLTIASGCGNRKLNSLQLSNYPVLQSLTIQKDVFTHITSLEILNNPMLETIEIEGAFAKMNGYAIIRSIY